MAFVETPHTLRLQLTPAGEAYHAWSVAPLHTADFALLRV